MVATEDTIERESVNARPWRRESPPARILVIRLQALGDTILTFPYLQGLQHDLPDTKIDFLTRRDYAGIPAQLSLFDRVHSLRGGPDGKLQFLSALGLIPGLVRRHYDVVIDLQRNLVSRMVRRSIRPASWSEFDRFSPLHAGERIHRTITSVQIGSARFETNLELKSPDLGLHLLVSSGWNPGDDLVVLNPAGLFATRNWALEKYVEFARLWLAERNERARFLVLGVSRVEDKAHYLKAALGDRLIDLVGKTTAAEAFALVRRATLVLSEDSGLMHMAWTAGRPTVALLGSTRSDWSRPLGRHALSLDSSDLACGNCMEPTCRFGDVHCLARYTPRLVFDEALALLSRLGR